MTDFDEVLRRHGTGKRPDRAPVHPAPDGVPDDLVAAIGTLSAALESAEVARGHLYAFHRMSGTVDREVQEAIQELRDAGRDDIADAVDEVMVGRDALADMWSFQIVERYDAEYWSALRDTTSAAHRAAGLDVPHVFESDMKHQEQSGTAG